MSRSKPSGWIFIFLFFGALVLNAQNQTEQTNLPPFIKRNLQRDAARLSLRTKGLTQDLKDAPVKISELEQQTIFDILQQLYVENPLAKALFDCQIQTASYPEIASMQVVLARNPQGKSGITTLSKSSIIALDSLLFNYQLQIEGSTQWNVRQDVLHLRSRVPLNMEALSKKIIAIEGIEKVIFPHPAYFLTDLKAEKIENGWDIEFLVFEPNLENPTHSWKFSIRPDKEIVQSEKGNSLPSWISCQLP